MFFKSEGELVDASIVHYRLFEFGRDIELNNKKFELTFTLDELKPDFIILADSFIDQCRVDDLEQGFIDIPELEELNYPDFFSLLNNSPKLATDLMIDYLFADLFDHLFKRTKEAKIIINKIHTLDYNNFEFTMTGETFQHETF
ncbi:MULTISPECIES: hypothetical protein [Pseudomonas]|nr:MULTISPECIES: hypothetical protein [Pseudomonas]AZD83096.1 hypothetical protein C4K14_0241 [Pseudomonas chlororaphis subsp. aureofaciens]AZD89687.1 hypothetical protein C4K13_0239 [Pseudomonas chlororaphis subsp. aureofaciens]KAB0525666.1 hypothetical protein F7R16_27910 [Pseudomonas chlororaphis subsp. aureofaciens]TSD30145.1 hypothetical protein FCE86_011390 [Pseudomonas sp. ATCC 13985]WDG60762.1 hypothetical protein PUP52_02210 [Pseudomonas chlororaphis]